MSRNHVIQLTNATFLIAMFRTCGPDEAPWVAGFPDDPADTDPRNWAGRPILRGIPGFVQPANNNYVCVSTFRQDTDGSWRRRKANFSAMHAVMVDDVGTKISTERLVLPPSAMVETSPGNFQAWYFLDPVETNPVRADLIVKRMIAAGLSADAKDPGMRGVTRYGRLPVGRNGKAAYVEKLGKPFVHQVHGWEPERRFSIEDIASAHGLNLRPDPASQFRPLPPSQAADSLLPTLGRYGLYIGPISSLSGGHYITCPWIHEHTNRDSTGTAYFEPNEANGWHGGFKCHHGHCMDRGIRELQNFICAAERILKQRIAA